MTRPNHWLCALFMIGGGFLLLSAWALYRATVDGSPIADPHYYQRGLSYGQSALRQRAADASGWSIRVERTPEHLLIHLTDRHQQPVSAARGSLILQGRPDHAPVSLALSEIAPGSYSAPLSSWEGESRSAEINMEHQGRLLQRRLLLPPQER